MRGLASACILTLLRIWWCPNGGEAWKTWIDVEGNEICLITTNPHDLKKKLRLAVDVQLWREATVNDKMADEKGLAATDKEGDKWL